MGNLLIILLAVVLGVTIAFKLGRPGDFLEYPSLAAWAFVGLILLQAFALENAPTLHPLAAEKTILMAVLCFVATIWGHSASRTWNGMRWRFNIRKLEIVAMSFVVGGGFFYIKMSRLPEELTGTTAWSGLPVAYRFFATVVPYGAALGLLLFLSHKSRLGLASLAMASVFFIDRAVIAGRRSVAAEFTLIVLLGWWFTKRKTLPRSVFVAMALFGVIVLYSGGQYRSIAVGERVHTSLMKGDVGPDFSRLGEIELVANLQETMREGGTELRAAAHAIGEVDGTKRFDLGLYHWNQLVFNFVPAQLLGKEFKESLMFDLAIDAVAFGDYDLPTGTTKTGLADAFCSFWYFGCMKFFAIAFILGGLYRAAREGSLVAQLFYMVLIVGGLHAITHQTQLFFTRIIHTSLFLMPALYLAQDNSDVRRLPEPARSRGLRRKQRRTNTLPKHSGADESRHPPAVEPERL